MRNRTSAAQDQTDKGVPGTVCTENALDFAVNPRKYGTGTTALLAISKYYVSLNPNVRPTATLASAFAQFETLLGHRLNSTQRYGPAFGRSGNLRGRRPNFHTRAETCRLGRSCGRLRL